LSYLHGVVSCRKPHSIWYAVSPFWGYPDRLLGGSLGETLLSIGADFG
jgi:hypothetical protein